MKKNILNKDLILIKGGASYWHLIAQGFIRVGKSIISSFKKILFC